MSPAFCRRASGSRLRGHSDNRIVRVDDPLSPFFVKTAFLVVGRRRIARFDRTYDGIFDVARYPRGETLLCFLLLLALRLVDQDVVAVECDPMIAWSISLAAARNRFPGCPHRCAGGVQLSPPEVADFVADE